MFNRPDYPMGTVSALKAERPLWSRGPPFREPLDEVFGEIQSIQTMFIMKQAFTITQQTKKGENYDQRKTQF
jgi:hypothetical protein